MSDKWSHETITSLLSLCHKMADQTNQRYSLTRGMQVMPESRVLRRQGHNAILETCNPRRKEKCMTLSLPS